MLLFNSLFVVVKGALLARHFFKLNKLFEESKMQSRTRMKQGASDLGIQRALQLARHTSTLDLSNYDLCYLPQEVWDFHKLVFGSDKWWELLPLKRLVLSHNTLSVFPSAEDDSSDSRVHNPQDDSFLESFGELQFLSLSYNQLREISPRLFVLPHLTWLDLQHNSLTDSFVLSVSDYFSGHGTSCSALQSLQYLNLAHNQFTQMGTWLCSCESLTELNLSHNQLQKWGCITLSRLQRLDLSHNRLTALCVTSLSRLVELEAHHNRLQTVDLSPLLTRLELSYNAIRSVPSVGRFIQELFLSHNLIACFSSSSLTPWYSLQTLDLSDNSLDTLSFDFAMCTALCRLHLANNYLDTLPGSLATLTRLTVLTLHGNPFHSLPTLRRFVSSNTQHTDTAKVLDYLRRLRPEPPPVEAQSLSGSVDAFSVSSNSQPKDCPQKEALNISGEKAVEMTQLTSPLHVTWVDETPPSVHSLRLCRLRLRSDTLPPLTALTSLTSLDLSHNLLCALPPISSLSCLRSLHLDYNRLVSLDFLHLSTLSSLHTLTVSNNNITNVNALTALKSLTYCDLSNNDLQNLDPRIGLMTTLKTLNLEGNPIRSIRRPILERGVSAILSYLRSQLTIA